MYPEIETSNIITKEINLGTVTLDDLSTAENVEDFWFIKEQFDKISDSSNEQFTKALKDNGIDEGGLIKMQIEAEEAEERKMLNKQVVDILNKEVSEDSKETPDLNKERSSIGYLPPYRRA